MEAGPGGTHLAIMTTRAFIVLRAHAAVITLAVRAPVDIVDILKWGEPHPAAIATERVSPPAVFAVSPEGAVVVLGAGTPIVTFAI